MSVPENKRYGTWAGNPRGNPEDPLRCREQVRPSTGSWIAHQCLKKRGHGPGGEFCKQHAKRHEDKS